MARIHRLDDPDFAQTVAEQYVAGKPMTEIAEELDIGRSTLAQYIKDPRVQMHARRISAERSTRIARKIDGEIEARLARVHEWTIEEVLKVRKEYLDRPLKIGAGEDADLGKTSNELSEAMDANPDFAEMLIKFANGKKTPALTAPAEDE